MKEQKSFNIKLNSDCLGENMKQGVDTEFVRSLIAEGKMCVWFEKYNF